MGKTARALKNTPEIASMVPHFPARAFLTLNLLLVAQMPLAATNSAEHLFFSTTRGVIVENVEKNSVLDRAGISRGDHILGWKRPFYASSPAGLSTNGNFETVYDWLWFIIEESPRGGTLNLVFRRGPFMHVLHVDQGPWIIEVQPPMDKISLSAYKYASTLLEDGELDRGVAILSHLARHSNSVTALRSWLLTRAGDSLVTASRWDEAIGYYTAAFDSLHAPEHRFVLGIKIAQAYERRSDHQTAYNSFAEILASFPRSSLGCLAEAKLLSNLGRSAWFLGDAGLATTHYTRSFSLLRDCAPDSLELARASANLGNIETLHGRPENAKALYLQALKIQQTLLPDGTDTAMTLNNLGYIAGVQGDSRKEEEYYRRALEIQEQKVPRSLEASISQLNLGAALMERGNLELAEELFQRALAIRLSLHPESLHVAQVYHNLGILVLAKGQQDLAGDYFQRALQIRQKLAPGSWHEAGSLSQLGALAYQRNDPATAKHYYESALSVYEQIAPDSIDTAETINNLGAVLESMGELEVAAQYYGNALRLKKRIAPQSLELARTINNLALLEASKGNLEKAEELHREALAMETQIAPTSGAIAETLFDLASLYRRRGDILEATNLLARAMDVLDLQVDILGGHEEDRADFRALFSNIYETAIDNLAELNRVEEAFFALERSRARALLNMIAERDIIFSDLSVDLSEELRSAELRHEAIQRLFVEAQRNPDLLQEVEKKFRAWRVDYNYILEKIRQASPKLAGLKYTQPITLAGAQKALPIGTKMLIYSVGKDRTTLFIVDREAPTQVRRVAVRQEELAKEVHLFRKLILESPAPIGIRQDSTVRLARRLYATLLGPAGDLLEDASRLLIIPHGPLHVLPWGSLIREAPLNNERPWQYLAEWKPLHTTLSATLYAEVSKSSHTSKDSTNLSNITVFGDPLHHEGSPEESGPHTLASKRLAFEPLPSSREEVTRIATLFPQARVFLGREATEQAVASIPRSSRIVHFATHAILDESFPLNSAVVLSPQETSPGGSDNGLLQSWEIFEKVRFDADLVVLSACQSGLGKEVGGEGLIGLTRAFQYAGARSVMASLWKISDRTTAEFMVRFYGHLKEGLSKDVALRATQMEFIRGPIQVTNDKGERVGFDASAPYYWAAFQIYGDWQ